MPRNRYLRDRMIGRTRNRDMRNPYGSRGGYVSSDRGYNDYDFNDYRDDYNDYRRDYRMRDYGRDYTRDYADMEDEYNEELEKWCKKLEKKDKFGLSKQDILHKAKLMNIRFDDFNEKEFMTTYYMMVSDYPSIASSPENYIAMAKDFLMDDDAELKGSEKLSAYYYTIVKGE